MRLAQGDTQGVVWPRGANIFVIPSPQAEFCLSEINLSLVLIGWSNG